MPDVREQIRTSRPQPDALTPIDLDRLAKGARRRTATTRGATALAVVAVLAGGVVAVDALRPPQDAFVGPGDDNANTGTTTGTDGEGAEQDSPDGLGAAIERLIAANREAPPHPVAGDGEVVIERTYALWANSTSSGEVSELEAVWYEQRIDDRGIAEIIRAPLGAVEPSVDLASLRDQAASFFDAGPPETEPLGDSTPAEHATSALDAAEADSWGSAEPAPGSTERPDQMRAFMRAADALRTGLQPADRIRALEVIVRLDPSIVEHRGLERDLLGREGIAIAGRDGTGEHVSWSVLIFDPETGGLLGEYEEHHVPGEDVPTITTYTARETVVLDADG